jgi:long-chain acyl-CoA synthetase
MTETSPVITLNLYKSERLGSVGQALDGVEVRLTEEGELLTRGPHVMLGYYNDPEATRAILRDGWLATGDLARMDAGGYVTITGRRKEILVLSNGKNICCAALEQALESSPYIQHAFAVGEGRNYVNALLVPHLAHVAEAARERGIAFDGTPGGLLAPAIVELFRQEAARAQAALAHFEQAKRFCFLPEEALLDPELVTPTQKVRRAVLHQKYACAIDRLYRQEEPFLADREHDCAEPVIPLETVTYGRTSTR